MDEKRKMSAEDIVSVFVGTFELADSLGHISQALAAVVLSSREMFVKNGVDPDDASSMAIDVLAMTLDFVKTAMETKGDKE